MSFTISDETLRHANITEQEAKIELACRLFDIDKLALWSAAQLAGLRWKKLCDSEKLRSIGSTRSIGGRKRKVFEIWKI